MHKINCIYITFNGLTDPLGQSQVLPYLEGLSKEKVHFYLISLEKNLGKSRKLEKDISKIGITWYRLKYVRISAVGMLYNILQTFLLTLFLLITKKIDVIHTRAYSPTFAVLLLKKVFNVKLIFDMRGFWPEELVDSNRIKKDSIYYNVLKFLEKKSILASDYIVTLTNESKEIIKDQYKDRNLKIDWMPTCVDSDRFNTHESISINNKFIVVYSGSLWNYYDVPKMVDFFKVLKSKITNAHFLILGNNGIERLPDLFLKKGIKREDYTVLSLDPYEVPKYLSGCSLGISITHNTYSEKAAFRTKFAEYFMSGLPVAVSTQCNFIKEMIKSNKVGVIIENFNEEAYGKNVDDLMILLKDEGLKDKCREVSKKYLDKKVCINKYMEIYNKL